jgi:DNA-binding IclR family transcriptional regulator
VYSQSSRAWFSSSISNDTSVRANSKKYTDRTITDPDKLSQSFSRIRRSGFAIDIDEYIVGVSSIAVGITDSKDKIIGAVDVVGPTARLTYQRMLKMVPEIKNTALEISNWIRLRDS